jgi:hypothetical protein
MASSRGARRSHLHHLNALFCRVVSGEWSNVVDEVMRTDAIASVEVKAVRCRPVGTDARVKVHLTAPQALSLDAQPSQQVTCMTLLLCGRHS